MVSKWWMWKVCEKEVNYWYNIYSNFYLALFIFILVFFFFFTVIRTQLAEDLEKRSAKSLCIPFRYSEKPLQTHQCFACQEKSQVWTLFGRSYWILPMSLRKFHLPHSETWPRILFSFKIITSCLFSCLGIQELCISWEIDTIWKLGNLIFPDPFFHFLIYFVFLAYSNSLMIHYSVSWIFERRENQSISSLLVALT